MGSSSPESPHISDLMASDSLSDAQTGISSPNPPLIPTDTDSRPGDSISSSPPNSSPNPAGHASSGNEAGSETTSPFYPPSTGEGYEAPALYHVSHLQGAHMRYGGAFPGQPVYCPPPPPYVQLMYDPLYEKKRHGCLCRLVTLIFILILAVPVLGLLLNLMFGPQYPSVSLVSVTVSPFDISSHAITSYFNVTFSIRNTNDHMDIYYSEVMTSVSYGFDTISSSPQPQFFQDARSETSKVFRIVEYDKGVFKSTIMGIKNELAKDRVVKFEVGMDAEMRYRQIMWFEKSLSALCSDVQIRFVNGTANGGTMLGPPITCVIDK